MKNILLLFLILFGASCVSSNYKMIQSNKGPIYKVQKEELKKRGISLKKSNCRETYRISYKWDYSDWPDK